MFGEFVTIVNGLYRPSRMVLRASVCCGGQADQWQEETKLHKITIKKVTAVQRIINDGDGLRWCWRDRWFGLVVRKPGFRQSQVAHPVKLCTFYSLVEVKGPPKSPPTDNSHFQKRRAKTWLNRKAYFRGNEPHRLHTVRIVKNPPNCFYEN